MGRMQNPSSMNISMKVENLLEFMRANPHLAAESKDNQKCENLFRKLGMLEHFRRSSSPNLSVGTFREHQSHWIVGLLWSGYPSPDGNGFRVFCLPKSQLPEHAVNSFVQYVMERYGGYGREDYEITLPTDWRGRS
jgi:hypothetical protein